MVSRLVWFSVGVAAGIYLALRADAVVAGTAGQPTSERMLAVATESAADLMSVVGGATAQRGVGGHG